MDSPPLIKIWNQADWSPPACVGWAASDSSTLVVTAARFRYGAGVEGLRRRIGAISELTGILYWSTTRQRWQPLIVEAYAVTDGAGARNRKDFSPEEVVEGRALYLQQADNLLGKATYRIRVAAVSAGRLVFSTENTSPLKFLGIPVLPSHEMQSICFLERESKDLWRYYNLTRIGRQAAALLGGHDASLINRAVASYRYLAGIPTDTEPPAAR